MEEEKKLYPMHICSILDEYGWGSEEFKLADLGYRDSLIRDGWLKGNSISELMETYLDRVVGENVYEYTGRQFPVTVKELHIKGKYPLQVHPDDTIAADRFDFLGKEKIWYIKSAGNDAAIHIGFAKDTDASEFLAACEDGRELSLLNSIAPHAGQFIHIAPGTVHGASGSLEIVEISEASPMDFCVSGMGEPVSDEQFDPVFSLIEALDFINFKAWKADKLTELEQFGVNPVKLDAAVHIDSGKTDSVVSYYGLSGEAALQIDVLGQKVTYTVKENELLLIPAEIQDYTLLPAAKGTVLLEIVFPKRNPLFPL